MSDFKGRHFEGEIVLWAVRWYYRYGVSHRDLERCGRIKRRRQTATARPLALD